MGRRNDIDWDRIQNLYCAGQLTVRQVAEVCGVTHQSITKRVKLHGWKRNLTEAIQKRTQEKIALLDVAELIESTANENAQKSAQIQIKAIEDASDAAAGVVLRHRKSFREQFERAQKIEKLFDDLLKVSEAGLGKDSDSEAAIDIPKAALAFKSLVDSRAKLVEQERKSFNLETAAKPEDDRDLDSLPAAEAWKIASEALK